VFGNNGASVPSYSGTTTISGGTLQIGNGPGSLYGYGQIGIGAIVDNATLVFNRSGICVCTDALTGSGNLLQMGSGTVVLGGTGTTALSGTAIDFLGTATVDAGTLVFGGTSGSSTVGSVSVGSSGTLAPSFTAVATTLDVGSLSLATSAGLKFDLNTHDVAPGTGGNSLLQIGGLTIGQAVKLTVSAGTGWGNGIYCLASYSGALTDNSSNFSGWTVTGTSGSSLGNHSYEFFWNGNNLDVAVLSANAVWESWTGTGSGSTSWSKTADWSGGKAPGSTSGDWATFGPGIGANAATITLDGTRTLGRLSFATTGGGSYTLSRTATDTTSSLTLSNSGYGVSVAVTGNQTINVPVTLADSTTVALALGSGLTVSGAISGAASNTLSVVGAGTLLLSGSNTYAGATTVASGGTLALTGSLSSSSSVTVSSSGILTGTGTAAGSVTVAGGCTVWPGYGGAAGVLSCGTLTLANSSILDFNLNAPGGAAGANGNSLLKITGGLNVGTGIALSGTMGAGSGPGTYCLATFTGTKSDNSSGFSGWTASGIGRGYSFSFSGGSLDLTVGNAGVWTASGSGSWGLSSNWQSGIIPGGTLDGATFGNTIGSSSATVTLDGSRTVGALAFSNTAGSYTLSRSNNDTTSSLTLDNSGGAAIVSSVGNNDTIAVPITLAGNVSFAPSAGSTLTVSGAISGAASNTLSVGGGGRVVLTASNTYSGGTTINGGTLQLGDGVATNGSVAGSIVVNGGNLTFANPSAQTYSGSLSGSGTLTETGAGALTLSGTNITFVGNATISSGTLQVYDAWTGGASASGGTQAGFSIGPGPANTLNIGPNGVLEMSVGTASVYKGDGGAVNGSLGDYGGTTITGSGVFLKVGNGTLGFECYNSTPAIKIAMSPSGLIDIEGGELRNSGWNGAIWTSNSASMTIGPSGVFEFWNGNPVQIDALNGTGQMLESYGNMSWTMTLGVASGSGSYSGHVSVGGTDSFNIVKDGTGTQVLSGTGISYDGNVTVNAGTLRFVNAINFEEGGDPHFSNTFTTSAGATLEFNVGTNTGFSTDGSNESIGTYNEHLNITGNGVFLKTGPGVLGLGDQSNQYVVDFNMTGGTIDIEGGTLKNGGWQNAAWTPAWGANNLSSMTIGASGTLDLWDGRPVQIDALNGSGTITSGDGNTNVGLTMGINNGSGAFSGTILAGPITKSGSGTQVLSGANTYTGNTNLNGGVLQLAGPNAVQNSTVVASVNNGLAFATSQTYNVGGLAGAGNVSLTAAGGGPATLSVGGNNQSTIYGGSLTGLGGLTKDGTGTLSLSASQSYLGATTISNGVLQLQGSPLVAYYNFDGTLADGSGNGNIGTANGALTYAPGMNGHQAISLNGSSSWVSVNYSPSLANLTSYTVSAWVNASVITSDGIVGTRIGGDETFDMKLDTGGTRIHGDIGNGSNWITTSADANGSSLSTNTWYMVTYSVSTTGYTVYLNSTAVANGALSTTPLFMTPSETLGIGMDYRGEYFNGLMQNVSIYDTALSSANVAALFAANGVVVAGGGSKVLPTSTPVSVNATGTLDLHGVSQQVASLSDGPGGGGKVINSSGFASTLTLSPSGRAKTTFSGQIVGGSGSGIISLVMSGSGTEVLAGTNTYTGGTTVTGGTLDFATPAATPWVGIITVKSGGYVVLGALVGASSPAVEEESATETTETTKTAAETSGTVATTSTDSPTTATVGDAAEVPLGSVVGVVGAAAVPEPGTLVLVLAGAAGLAVAAWKRRRLAR
jgi:autotransporter-associated beta strand protein